jgi:hypothetical protein
LFEKDHSSNVLSMNIQGVIFNTRFGEYDFAEYVSVAAEAMDANHSDSDCLNNKHSKTIQYLEGNTFRDDIQLLTLK